MIIVDLLILCMAILLVLGTICMSVFLISLIIEIIKDLKRREKNE